MKKVRFIPLLFIFFFTMLFMTSCKDYDKLAEEIKNNISESIITSNLRLEANFSTSWVDDSYLSKTSSATIIKKTDNKYYALTNNHNVYSKYQYMELKVTDYYDNTYTATLIENSNLAKYDLALIEFEADASLNVLKLASSLPKKNDIIASVSECNGLRNEITTGKYLGLTTYEIPSDTSSLENSISFDVISHDAYIGECSSGSMLVNYDLELVGINFSSGKSNGEFVIAYAIQSEKIIEYLNEISFEI